MAESVGGLNPLQRLIQDWLDAEPGRTIGDLALRVHGDRRKRNTFDALMQRDAPRQMPSKATMRSLALALEFPFRAVVDAAVAATYQIERVALEADPDIRATVAHMESQPANVRKQIARIVRTFREGDDST